MNITYTQEMLDEKAWQNCLNERCLKIELLEEEPDVLKENILDFGIDNLLNFHIYHFNNIDTAREILEAVKIVIDNDDKLSDIGGLRPDTNWKAVVYAAYAMDIPENEDWTDEDMYPITEEEEKIAAEIEAETDKILAKLAQSNAGKKSKTNHIKKVTLHNIAENKDYEFNTTKEALQFLNTNIVTFGKLKKGKSNLAKTWSVI